MSATITGTPTQSVSATVPNATRVTHTVNISLPSGITRDSGGALIQVVLGGNEMAQIVLTTSGNFIMPDSYPIGNSGLWFNRVNDRTAHIEGRPTAGVTHTVTAPTPVTQTTPTLGLSPGSWSAPAAGGSTSVNVSFSPQSPNTTWTVAISPPAAQQWLSVVNTGNRTGNGSFTLTAQPQQNNDPARNGTVTVTPAAGSGIQPQSFSVSQLAAQTTPGQRQVTFHPNGGSGHMDPVPVNIGAVFSVPPSSFIPPAANLEFSHWNSRADGTGTSRGAHTFFEVQGDIQLHAQWRTIPADRCTGCGLYVRILDRNVAQRIRISVNSPNVTDGQIQGAINDWNRSPHVSFLPIERGLTLEENPTVTATVTVEVFGPNDVHAGFFQARSVNANNVFTQGRIVLRRSHWEAENTSEGMRGQILRHEMGHLLGLYHPSATCVEMAVMQQRREEHAFSRYSSIVTNHDLGALTLRFPPENQPRGIWESFDFDTLGTLLSHMLSTD